MQAHSISAGFAANVTDLRTQRHETPSGILTWVTVLVIHHLISKFTQANLYRLPEHNLYKSNSQTRKAGSVGESFLVNPHPSPFGSLNRLIPVLLGSRASRPTWMLNPLKLWSASLIISTSLQPIRGPPPKRRRRGNLNEDACKTVTTVSWPNPITKELTLSPTNTAADHLNQTGFSWNAHIFVNRAPTVT